MNTHAIALAALLLTGCATAAPSTPTRTERSQYSMAFVADINADLTDYANKVKTRTDLFDVTVVQIGGVPCYYLVAVVGDNDEARSWVQPLDDDLESSEDFMDDMVNKGAL